MATLGTLLVFGLGYRTGEVGGELVYQHDAARVHAQVGTSSGAPDHTRDDDD